MDVEQLTVEAERDAGKAARQRGRGEERNVTRGKLMLPKCTRRSLKGS